MTMTETVSAALDRAEACAAWLREMFQPQDGGRIRLATHGRDGWHEWPRGVLPGAGDFDGLSWDASLDALALSLVAEADKGHDIYACPYAHKGARRNGGAVTRRHVHADVDGPLDLARVRFVGGMAVASGSTDAAGQPHGHVYVRLTEDVPPHAHEALCRALGQTVGQGYADPSKVADADVLRPAGTVNHKGGQTRPVSWLVTPDDSHVRTWQPDALARLLGVVWPVPEVTQPEPSTTPAALSSGATAARLDGLTRAVAEAAPGRGNGTLNWAAGVAAGVCASTEAAPAAQEVRTALVAAYLSRPNRDGRNEAARRREAQTTVRSGWAWGEAHPAAAHRLTKHDPEDHAPMTEPDHEEFWTARPLLSDVRDFARARRIGPWALLGAVLAHAAASVPPSVVLPPTRGTVASLNLYVGLCSESGGGKSAALDAAEEFLRPVGGCDYLTTSLGSGEGLLAAYVYVKTERGKAPEVVQNRLSVLMAVDEVGALGALTNRTASTLLPFLKSAWSGRLLATQNAEAARLRRVEAHRYRLALVCGVQPQHAGVILDDESGGFPQRWLWMPTYDPEMIARGTVVIEPSPHHWTVPAPRFEMTEDGTLTVPPERRVLTLPADAVAAILAAAEETNRPIGAASRSTADGLDGHALLTRAKVAGLLALLDGREVEVSAEDWRLAGVVMAVSDQTRAAVIAVRGRAAEADSDRRAQRAGRSAAIAAESEAEETVLRVMATIRNALGRRGGEVSRHEVGRVVGSRNRAALPEALDRLSESGEVLAEDRKAANGKTSTYYRLAVES